VIDQQYLTELRTKVAAGTITDDELREWVKTLRADRLASGIAPKSSGRTKSTPLSAEKASSLLDSFLSPKE
jgi:hypothetical protein